MITLQLGKTPPLENTFISINKISGNFYYSLIQKYFGSNIGNLYPVEYLTPTTINGEKLEKLKLLKDDYLTILNVIINQLNYSNYLDLRLTTILQCYEGFYRNHFNINGSTFAAFHHLFSTNNTNAILNSNDKTYVGVSRNSKFPNTKNIVQHLYDHRNYFSHYAKKMLHI